MTEILPHLLSEGATGGASVIGYRRALERAGLPADEDLVVATHRFHRGLGAEAMDRLLALPEPPDAVFCYNDLLAIGAMHALRRAGLRVPEDVAVIGIDGIQEGAYSFPTLTSVTPDKAELARTAVRTLVSVIEGEPVPPAGTRVPHRLVLRGSTEGSAGEAAEPGPV